MSFGRRGRRAIGLALVVAVLVAGGVAWRVLRRPPDIIVIVADTLRDDRLGSPRGLTPVLDGLAAESARFTRTYSASSWTMPAIASLFTSRYPSEHGVVRYDSRLPSSEVTLAERLRDASYVCLGFSANLLLAESLGFGQGFHGWFPYLREGKMRAADLTRDAIAMLDELDVHRAQRWFWRRWTRKPLFLYLHYMEPHAPYEPPEPFRSRFGVAPPEGMTAEQANADLIDSRWDRLGPESVRFLESLYDGEVAALDAAMTPLFAALRARGLLDDAVIVLTADHGEEFREHGYFGHGITLYEESVRIPLLIRAPWGTGRVLEEPVSLVDVAPTLLALAGVTPEPRFEGRSLLGSLGAAGTPRRRDVLAQLLPKGRNAEPALHNEAFVRWPAKLLTKRPPIRAGSDVQLFDLANDPGERHDDPPTLAAEAPALRTSLEELLRTLATRASTPEVGAVTNDVKDRLRALGYAQ